MQDSIRAIQREIVASRFLQFKLNFDLGFPFSSLWASCSVEKDEAFCRGMLSCMFGCRRLCSCCGVSRIFITSIIIDVIECYIMRAGGLAHRNGRWIFTKRRSRMYTRPRTLRMCAHVCVSVSLHAHVYLRAHALSIEIDRAHFPHTLIDPLP